MQREPRRNAQGSGFGRAMPDHLTPVWCRVLVMVGFGCAAPADVGGKDCRRRSENRTVAGHMIAGLVVAFYRWWHGTLHRRGAGMLLRRCARFVPRLHDYPLRLAGVGTARVDFRDGGSFYLLNWSLGDWGDEKQLLRLVETVVKPGGVLYDVGANVGLVSAHFARDSFALSRVVAFEPNPAALKSLASLFAGHARVTVVPCGLGDADATATLNAPIGASIQGSLVYPYEGGHKVQVQIRQGDAVVRELNLPPPDVIKIDAEGYEPKVLAGLAETIARHQPIIFFEHICLMDGALAALAPDGYEMIFIGDDGKLFPELDQRKRGHDAILVPRGRLTLFRPPA
jgi:FkbM family methyltransferase